MPSIPPHNAHVHLPPNFSAFESVSQAVSLASAQGLRLLGASNYYDFTVYETFGAEARAAELFPLFGLEIIALLEDLQQNGVKINDPGNPGKLYLCGKGISRFAPLSPEAEVLLGTIRNRDAERMERMTQRLHTLLAEAGIDTGLSAERIKSDLAHRYGCATETVYLQERHLAQAFQEALFQQCPVTEREATLTRLFGTTPRRAEDPATVQNEIRTHLMKAGRPAYVEETFVDFHHAYRLILALGGIPCYPLLADGAHPICAFEEPLHAFIEALQAWGIHCVEVIPLRNDPEVLTRYVLALREAGITVTAGTEHNTPDLVPLQPTCKGGAPIPEALQALFWEGACVAAAHQHLTARGEAGYVDGEGNLNSAFASAEERIRHFAQQGAELIAEVTFPGTAPL